MTRPEYGKGLIAGLIATVVLSALMVIKGMMGMMPALNVPKMLGHMSGGGPMAGWIAHFVIGTVIWGLLFAAIYNFIPARNGWLKGAIFSIGAWLIMMIVVMPMAGAGLFGSAMGLPAPIMTLVLHLVFGVVLGAVYAGMTRQVVER
ncbi:MAG: hypothetical protein PVI56_10295 [Gammaproteobacteria bacterium]|jgi:hypothetical protein